MSETKENCVLVKEKHGDVSFGTISFTKIQKITNGYREKNFK